MGYRSTGFPNHHDENWPSQAFELHGVLEKVTQFTIKPNLTSETKIKSLDLVRLVLVILSPELCRQCALLQDSH